MKQFCTVLAIAIAAPALGQNLNNVTYTPGTPHSCQLITFTLYGTFPSNDYDPIFFAFDTATFTVAFHAQGSGTSPTTSFNQAINPIGPFTPGPHTFTFELYLNGIVTDTYTLTLNVVGAPTFDPGTSTYSNEVCPAGPTIPLLSFLDGSPDSGGDWFFISGFGPVAHGNNFVPGTDQAGYYIYLFDVQPPCTDTASEVQIVYLPGNSPGFGNFVEICHTGAAIDLFDSLYGVPYSPGTWTAPGGASFSGIYDPDVNAPGNYTYTVPPIAPCTVGSSAVINVTEFQPGDAGTGGPVVVCESDTAFPIFSTLTGSPDTTGYWYDPSNIIMGTWSTPYNALLAYPGVYSYVVYSANCTPDTAQIIVTEEAEPCGIGIDELLWNDRAFTLRPNPTDGMVTLTLALPSGERPLNLEIISSSGSMLRTVPLAGRASGGSVSLMLEDLPSGVVTIRLSTDRGRYAQRLVLR